MCLSKRLLNRPSVIYRRHARVFVQHAMVDEFNKVNPAIWLFQNLEAFLSELYSKIAGEQRAMRHGKSEDETLVGVSGDT